MENMPIYEFQCKKCKECYDAICSITDTKYKKVKCPSCKSSSKERLVSNFAFNFSNPIGTDRWCSDSMGHDYRFNWNLPNVRKQREAAERASHVGPDPYGNLD